VFSGVETKQAPLAAASRMSGSTCRQFGSSSLVEQS
jgi:hypothetical protein